MMREHSKTWAKLFSTTTAIIATRTLQLVPRRSLPGTSNSAKSRQSTVSSLTRKMTSLATVLHLWILSTSTLASSEATRSIAKWAASLSIRTSKVARSRPRARPTEQSQASTKEATQIKDKSLFDCPATPIAPRWTKAWSIMVTLRAEIWTTIHRTWTLFKWRRSRLRNPRYTTRPFKISAAIRIRT